MNFPCLSFQDALHVCLGSNQATMAVWDHHQGLLVLLEVIKYNKEGNETEGCQFHSITIYTHFNMDPEICLGNYWSRCATLDHHQRLLVLGLAESDNQYAKMPRFIKNFAGAR